MANLQRDLVKRAADGDQEAFESLVRLSAGRLFAIAYRVLRDHDRAEDALQQTLATIWNELPRLRDPDRFEAWGYRLIVRASVAQARHERRGEPVVRLLPNDADTIATQGPDEFDRIADILGITIGTAGSRLHHASRALRAVLDADDRIGSLKERTA